MTEPTYSGDELRTLRDHLLGPRDADATEGDTVPKEGTVVDPPRLSADDYLRDYVRRMFDRDYAATEPELPEGNPQ